MASVLHNAKDTVIFVESSEKLDGQPIYESEVSAPSTKEPLVNYETREIDWNCPCLGGLAQGPCGENFKEAFTCFVFSENETKGSECIEQFKAMQDCFKQYPEQYKAFNDDVIGAQTEDTPSEAIDSS